MQEGIQEVQESNAYILLQVGSDDTGPGLYNNTLLPQQSAIALVLLTTKHYIHAVILVKLN